MNSDKKKEPFDSYNFRLVEQIANLLDSKFTIPGTRFKFGLDPILNLFPVLGDGATFVVQSILAIYMMRFGASRKVVIRMLLNVAFDSILGAIPIVGQIGDFFFKANTKNIKLLKEHYQEGKHQGKGWGIIIILLVIMLLFFATVIYASYKLFVWLLHVIEQYWA